jgi:hypothetical protein
VDAVKYNDDASLIFGHASSNWGKSLLFAAGYDGKKIDFKEYVCKENFNLLQVALQFGKFDTSTKKSNAFVIAEVDLLDSRGGFFIHSVLVKTDGNTPPGKV